MKGDPRDYDSYCDGYGDEPEFTGRCPRCFGFIKREPRESELSLGVWRYDPEWGTHPDNPTEDERAEWQALRDEMARLRLIGGAYDRILEIERRIRTDFIEEWPEPYWTCAKCGHDATAEEVYR
jgi:hypothetical protein